MLTDSILAIKSQKVLNHKRENFWHDYFSAVPEWLKIENLIFQTLDNFCEVYQGAFWEFCTLSNQGAFLYPNMFETTLTLFNSHNSNEATMSPEAAGIAVCLIVFSLWSFKTESEVMVDRFYQLRNFAIQHPESAEIFHLID